ncbi:hypothetical protein AVEN_239605-1, partial [Araneus ventricosus]
MHISGDCRPVCSIAADPSAGRAETGVTSEQPHLPRRPATGQVVTHRSSVLNSGINIGDASRHRTAVSVADATKAKSEWNSTQKGGISTLMPKYAGSTEERSPRQLGYSVRSPNTYSTAQPLPKEVIGVE